MVFYLNQHPDSVVKVSDSLVYLQMINLHNEFAFMKTFSYLAILVYILVDDSNDLSNGIQGCLSYFVNFASTFSIRTRIISNINSCLYDDICPYSYDHRWPFTTHAQILLLEKKMSGDVFTNIIKEYKTSMYKFSYLAILVYILVDDSNDLSNGIQGCLSCFVNFASTFSIRTRIESNCLFIPLYVLFKSENEKIESC
jgi:hypothetical protein